MVWNAGLMSRGRVKIKSGMRDIGPQGLRLEDLLVPTEQVAEQVDFAAIFGNDRPVEVEIGPGKGGFLIAAAEGNPDRNFLGIEVAKKFLLYVADRAVRRGLRNIRLLHADARHLFIWRMPAEVIDVLHVYHPDPWPKKRHHKRRLFCDQFVAAAIRALKPAGRWQIQTDHAEYFEIIRDLLLGRPELQPIEFETGQPGTASQILRTNFAVRYGQKGQPIFRLALAKKAAAIEAPCDPAHGS